MSWAFDAMDDARERAEQVNQLREENAQLRAQIAELLATKPGTWAWACERMLEGKTVERDGVSVPYWRAKIDSKTVVFTCEGCDWQLFPVGSVDLTATDWRVVEETGGA